MKNFLKFIATGALSLALVGCAWVAGGLLFESGLHSAIASLEKK